MQLVLSNDSTASEDVMNDLSAHLVARDMSPKAKARLAGFLYLLNILTGLLAQGYISAQIIVPGDAAATAHNILARSTLFRLGFATYLVEMVCQIAMTVLFYELLKPAGRSVSLVAAAISLVGCGIKTMSRLFYFAPLFILNGDHYLASFSGEQLQSLASLLLKVNDYGAAIALAFFGVYALLKGRLLYQSTFVPRALGVLTVIGGGGWIAFMWPPLGYRLFPYLAGLGLLGAVVNIFWFLVYGVDEARWRERAAEANASVWR